LGGVKLMRGGDCAQWAAKAAAVASNLKAQLWSEPLGAMFARDAADETITTMVHDSLRVMWSGAFDQAMADAFVTAHIMNRSEFWTPTPLPSISVADPRYNVIKNANTWSGRPMGLTFQRSIREPTGCAQQTKTQKRSPAPTDNHAPPDTVCCSGALERYAHHAESVMVGLALSHAILGFDGCATNRSHCHFTLEIDAFTSTPLWAPWSPHDGYGPMIMAVLEHTALRLGVVPRPPDLAMGPLRANATLLWSAMANATALLPASSNWTQVLGRSTYRLRVTMITIRTPKID
jgi:hypothetical protein